VCERGSTRKRSTRMPAATGRKPTLYVSNNAGPVHKASFKSELTAIGSDPRISEGEEDESKRTSKPVESPSRLAKAPSTLAQASFEPADYHTDRISEGDEYACTRSSFGSLRFSMSRKPSIKPEGAVSGEDSSSRRSQRNSRARMCSIFSRRCSRLPHTPDPTGTLSSALTASRAIGAAFTASANYAVLCAAAGGRRPSALRRPSSAFRTSHADGFSDELEDKPPQRLIGVIKCLNKMSGAGMSFGVSFDDNDMAIAMSASRLLTRMASKVKRDLNERTIARIAGAWKTQDEAAKGIQEAVVDWRSRKESKKSESISLGKRILRKHGSSVCAAEALYKGQKAKMPSCRLLKRGASGNISSRVAPSPSIPAVLAAPARRISAVRTAVSFAGMGRRTSSAGDSASRGEESRAVTVSRAEVTGQNGD